MDSRHYDPAKLASGRRSANLTQQQVAEAINKDRQTIYRAEAGTNASFELLAELCRLYKIPVTDVILPHPDLSPTG